MTFAYRPIQEKKKRFVGPSWIQTSAHIWQSLGDTELKPSDHLDSSIVVGFVFWQGHLHL